MTLKKVLAALFLVQILPCTAMLSSLDSKSPNYIPPADAYLAGWILQIGFGVVAIIAIKCIEELTKSDN